MIFLGEVEKPCHGIISVDIHYYSLIKLSVNGTLEVTRDKDYYPGALNIKVGRDVPIGSLDPYPFPDTIETPFQTNC